VSDASLTRPGARIGPYVLVRRLGAGGMGEVFLARDPRLEREVALKLLAPALTRDADHLARFRREALALAALNHPNIASIYGFEEVAGGTTVLVLERVEGESLGERLGRGALPIDEALHVCAQIAQALEAAHERGVVHRDMKPGNVMIGPRGLVKVLDFGLAKRTGGLLEIGGKLPEPPPAPPAPPAAAAPAAPISSGTFRRGPLMPPLPATPGSEDAATVVTPAPTPVTADTPTVFGTAPPASTGGPPLTEIGMAVGTPGYMSPEQVVAGEQDERTDVFAFGCVLFECLSGRRAFTGADVFKTMAAVLTDPVDFGRLPARTPARVRTLLERCLAKQAEQRLPDIRSARIELEEALGIRHATALRDGEAWKVPNNLPAQATSFVGREGALRECERLLSGTRLLTLAGMGGSGKTRLALRLAETQMEAHREGTWFIDLAPLQSDERVVEAAAAALGVHEEAGRTTKQSLLEHIGSRAMLLVIDNCEDVLAGAAALASALLAACPQVRVVATSREPLSVAGETVFAIPTLALPAKADVASAEASEAVRLFVARAAVAQPDFTLLPESVPAVVEICRRLDGIPLAIELAAARVKVLAVEQIRARLDDRFKLLTVSGTARTGAAARQQTLRATIQWSWDHLAPPEQALLRNLSVFVDGWTLERATAVVEENADEFEVLDLLTRLVEKSLVVVERGAAGATRYRFLETVWRFALEMLEASGGTAAVRSRHLAAYLAFAEASEPGLVSLKQGEWFADVGREQGNVLAALDWCAKVEDGGRMAMQLTTCVSRFWAMRGQYVLGLRAMQTALALAGPVSTTLRAKALVRACGFAMTQNNTAVAWPLAEESLAICRALNDRKGVARALSALGVAAFYDADLETAERIGREGRDIYQELGERRGVALVNHNLACIAWYRGDAPRTKELYLEALAELERLGDQSNQTMTQAGLGMTELALPQPDLAFALAQFRASLAGSRSAGQAREAVYLVEAVAHYAMFADRPAPAARLVGGAAAIRARLGSPLMPLESDEIDRLLARIRERIGSDGAEVAMASGRALAFEQVLDEVQAQIDAPPAAG
jgi:predicted ATPase/serine/threonine protein kinase